MKQRRQNRCKNFFDPQSSVIQLWDWLIVGVAIYSVVYVPLNVVLKQTRWTGYQSLEILFDLVFLLVRKCVYRSYAVTRFSACFPPAFIPADLTALRLLLCMLLLAATQDVLVKCRTSFLDHGYLVNEAQEVFVNYLHGWLIPDLLCAVPFNLMVGAALDPLRSPNYDTIVDTLQLLRVLRFGRLARKMAKLSSANVMLVATMILAFVLLGHFLGLGYYALAIQPLELATVNDTSRDWIWVNEDQTQVNRNVAIRYVCSIYWALSVMTNLKGLPAHETRQCLQNSDEVLRPIEERIYTICTFLSGAIFYSVIYGNIAQFIQAYYSSTLRYRKRMDEISEFSRFHHLPNVLRNKMRNYLEFAFSVTKGISVESIVAQLPAHLQLEVHLELNKKLVEKVHIFIGCDPEFFDALVIKLQPCICVADVYVFYDGEPGNKMYFVKHGMAEVVKNDRVVFTFKEGDYFGETFAQEPHPTLLALVLTLTPTPHPNPNPHPNQASSPSRRARPPTPRSRRLERVRASWCAAWTAVASP